MKSQWWSIYTSALTVFLCLNVSAKQIQIVDQNGDPVKNAVVSIAMEKIANEASDNVPSLPVAIMDQIDQQFSPEVLVIQKGQQVTFPNSDEIRHHVYSFSAINPFEIKLYKGSHGAPVQYTKAGVGVLGCNIHDNMIGFIYVADNEIAKVTSQTGIVTFNQSLPDEITVWHAGLSIQQTERIKIPIDSEDENIRVTVNILQKEKEEESNRFGSRKFGKHG
ncbi:MAG: methylamine utilization protein [Aliiglaciecola sp.]|uniref:methylamine utilization protein n=1 Tax=Aliiglaciecola sp. TaxID=1872441 RepID=UPI003299162A